MRLSEVSPQLTFHNSVRQGIEKSGKCVKLTEGCHSLRYTLRYFSLYTCIELSSWPKCARNKCLVHSKKGFFVGSYFQLVTGFVSAFVHSIPFFAALRFIVGLGLTGVMLSHYIFTMELIGPSTRTAAGNMIYFYYNGFQLLFIFIAYFERDWRILIMIVTLPAVFLFPFWK